MYVCIYGWIMGRQLLFFSSFFEDDDYDCVRYGFFFGLLVAVFVSYLMKNESGCATCCGDHLKSELISFICILLLQILLLFAGFVYRFH